MPYCLLLFSVTFGLQLSTDPWAVTHMDIKVGSGDYYHFNCCCCGKHNSMTLFFFFSQFHTHYTWSVWKVQYVAMLWLDCMYCNKLRITLLGLTMSITVTVALLIGARTSSTLSGVVPVAGPPEHESHSTDSRPSLTRLCHTFICVGLIASCPKGSTVSRTGLLWINKLPNYAHYLQLQHGNMCLYSKAWAI